MSKKQSVSVLCGMLLVMVMPSLSFAMNSATSSSASSVAAVEPLMKSATTSLRNAILQERAQAKIELQQAKQAFQQSLNKIKDQRKQQIVENINSRIQTVNQNQTDKMSAALDSLTAILGKIEDQKNALATSGANLTVLNTDISSATNAISTAKASVTVQAGKVYTINIVDDATLKTNVGHTVSQFRTDLASTHQDVVMAKQAVVKAAADLAKIISLTENQASNAATVTP